MTEIVELDAATVAETDLEFWHSMFPADAECFLCDQPVGEGRVVHVIAHPSERAKFLGVPVCGPCHSLPFMIRQNKTLKMLRAMWPNTVWRMPPPGYLTNLRKQAKR